MGTGLNLDFGAILNVVKNAQTAVSSAINYVKEVRATGVVLSDAGEEELEAEIKKLEDMLPKLRKQVQDKLRGTSD